MGRKAGVGRKLYACNKLAKKAGVERKQAGAGRKLYACVDAKADLQTQRANTRFKR